MSDGRTEGGTETTNRWSEKESCATFWRLAGVPAGRLSKWLVVLAWVALAVAAVPLGSKLAGVQENDAIAFLPGSAESTEVYELQDRFAEGQDPPAIVAYVREGGIVGADRAVVERDRQGLSDIAGVERTGPPVPSEDGEALMLTVPLEQPDDDKVLIGSVERIRGEVAAGAPEGLEVKVTGPAGAKVDQLGAIEGIDATLLLATVAVVALLLLLTYRSPVLWLLPLVSVGVASQVTNAVVYLLAKHAGLTVDAQSAGILTVLVFGAGTDYALLLISRYREELRRHADRHQAMAAALRHAGPAILASAATVAIALLCLLAADLNMNRTLGLLGAIGIACGFLAMMTLLPALLVIFGRWLFWPAIPQYGARVQGARTVWARVGGLVGRRPRIVWVLVAAVLAALSFGVAGEKTGLTAEGMYHATPDSVAGQELLAEHYPAGAADPAVVVANASAEREVTEAVRDTPGVSEVMPAIQDGDLVQIPAVLGDPPDGAAAEGTVERLREEVRGVPGADALVGGTTATNLDTRDAWAHDRQVVIPVVLAVVFVILALLLRSLIAPLVLVATVVLSFFASLGASSIVFERVFGFEALDQSLVLLGFVFLVALGIDYNIFLMTRVREEVELTGHRQGVLRGLAVTGGVITSAGLVLAATFAVLGVMPMVLLTQIGFLVAFGVLLDTLVVRSVVVPALALDLGPAIWWPGKLAHRNPDEPGDRAVTAEPETVGLGVG